MIRDLGVVLCVAAMAGWACRRLGWSSVVGYLAAGVWVGPHPPSLGWVPTMDRVRMLADLGLVFVIFGVGMGLSLGRLRRLGWSVGLAAGAGALAILNVCRFMGWAAGWRWEGAMCVAAMLMVSSSAIIAKALEDLRATHERWGQLALGVTVMEDVVAVVMLTVLTSMTAGDGGGGMLGATLGKLGAFVVWVTFVGVLLVPRGLRWMARDGAGEARTLLMAGAVLGVSWAASLAGYSPALGAFLLGMIVAGTPHRREAEQAFSGVRQVFGAVFFVAVGMSLDVQWVASSWAVVAGVTGLALLMRPIACAIGLILTGEESRDAMRAGLALAPLGEFSFVMAQAGVTAGWLPPWFMAVAVGSSLGTALMAPWVMSHSEAIVAWILRREPEVLRSALAMYRGWIVQLGSARRGSPLWTLVAGRVGQVVLHILFLSALLLFWHPAVDALVGRVGENLGVLGGTRAVFWTGFGLLLVGPVVALWRNVEAISMIVAEGASCGRPWRGVVQPWLERMLKLAGLLALGSWLVALLPFGGASAWIVWTVAGLVALAGVFSSARLARWHRHLEEEIRLELRRVLSGAGAAGMELPGGEGPHGWNLELAEVTLPEGATAAGRMIRELGLRQATGCSILRLERGGFSRVNPGPEEALFPGDRVLLLGEPDRLPEAEGILQGTGPADDAGGLEEATSETFAVPDGCPHAGQPLETLGSLRALGVQVCGIQRARQRIVMPSSKEAFRPGDLLLVVGHRAALSAFQSWLAATPGAASETSLSRST